MIQDFEELSKQFDVLLQTTLGNKHLINTYFRISKGTPEQTKKYFLLNSNIPRPIILTWNLLLIPLNMLKLGLILILSLVLFRQNFIYKRKIVNTQILFLSHGTKRNLVSNKKDTFFDLMPQNLQNKKNLNCTILYTNQSLFRFRIENRLLDQKNKELNHILLPKFLPFFEHLKYFSIIVRYAFHTSLTSFRYYFKKPDISRILICSISWYFSRATYSNFLLLNRMKEAQMNNAIDSIFLTFEGHSFEQLLIDWIEEFNQKANIFLYQHSPIVSTQYGIKSFLIQAKYRITVLTTGPFYKEYFQTISKVPSYKVIGTSKRNFLISNSTSKVTNKIIYAPEGTNIATKNFVDLIKHIIKDCPEYSHFLRLHPDLRLSSHLKIKLRRLRKYENFSMSIDDLDLELTNTKYLVYRSSAVGIESLKYDLVPIFYADANLFGLNVLFPNDVAYCKAQNPSEVINILKSRQTKLSKAERMNLLNSFFSNINYRIFKNIM
jgi:hypothetical protein